MYIELVKRVFFGQSGIHANKKYSNGISVRLFNKKWVLKRMLPQLNVFGKVNVSKLLKQRYVCASNTKCLSNSEHVYNEGPVS